MFGRKKDPLAGVLQLAIGTCFTCAREFSSSADAISSSAFICARIADAARDYPIPSASLDHFIEMIWPTFYEALPGKPHIGAFASAFVMSSRLWNTPGQTDAILPFYDWRQSLLKWEMARSDFYSWMSTMLDVTDSMWLQESAKWRR